MTMTHATATAQGRPRARQMPPPAATRVERREWRLPAPPAPSASSRAAPPCACGGSCPKCKAAAARSAQGGDAGAIKVSRPGDALEREADAAASRVVAGARGPLAHRADIGSVRHVPTATAPAPLRDGLRAGGRPLDAGTRAFMESGFGSDLSHVRIHDGPDAARSAAAIGARAYALGSDLVFGAGHYAPATSAGRRLLAHELAHVLQHARGAATAEAGVLRAPTISVLDENFIGPPSASQRRAARSCPIDCCANNLGTLHTMPLFFHESRGATVPAGSARATGIGAELHFIASPDQPAAGDLCHCDAFQMIQIITTTHPGTGHTAASYVDNGNAGTQPFYGAPAGPGLSGHGEHAIPGGYVDAGQRITTAESIYDRPYREQSTLGTTSLRWEAETCVACVKNTEPDRILGCTTYGFSQNFNPTTRSHDPVQQIAPRCRARASDNFISTLATDPTTTLSTDPTTSSYAFRPAPLLECLNPTPPGDYPLPRGDTRLA